MLASWAPRAPLASTPGALRCCQCGGSWPGCRCERRGSGFRAKKWNGSTPSGHQGLERSSAGGRHPEAPPGWLCPGRRPHRGCRRRRGPAASHSPAATAGTCPAASWSACEERLEALLSPRPRPPCPSQSAASSATSRASILRSLCEIPASSKARLRVCSWGPLYQSVQGSHGFLLGSYQGNRLG